MAKLKTIPTRRSVSDFLNTIEDRKKRAECRTIAKMMREATGNRARMRGRSVVGFDTYDYRYASGQEGFGHSSSKPAAALTRMTCGFSSLRFSCASQKAMATSPKRKQRKWSSSSRSIFICTAPSPWHYSRGPWADLAENPGLNSLPREFSHVPSPEEHEDIAVMLLKVIAADGRRDVDEIEMLNIAAENIEIAPETRHRAFEQYFAEQES